MTLSLTTCECLYAECRGALIMTIRSFVSTVNQDLYEAKPLTNFLKSLNDFLKSFFWKKHHHEVLRITPYNHSKLARFTNEHEKYAISK